MNDATAAQKFRCPEPLSSNYYGLFRCHATGWPDPYEHDMGSCALVEH